MEVIVKMTKKRKMCDSDLEISQTVSCSRSHTEDELADATANLDSSASCEFSTKENFDVDDLAACCASNGSSDVIEGSSKVVDLDECVENNSTSKSNSDFEESRETIFSSELKLKLEKLESITTKPRHAKSRRRPTVEKMPSEIELDEFFAVAEKDLHKQFVQKYNFDFVKEEPLKGSYEWVRL